jgi:hypothetical protein
MHTQSTYPAGPLSFLYHLCNSPEVREQFKTDPTQLMNAFSLSSSAQDAVKLAGDDLTGANIGKVISLVQQDVEGRADLMW